MSLYDDLPTDKEAAFLRLEEVYRERCEEACFRNSERSALAWADYMAQVVAAVEELQLTEEFQAEVPSFETVSYESYVEFAKNVTHYCTRLRIRTSRRASGFSIKFDEIAKIKLRHLIEQIRETVGKLEVDERKRNALFGKLSALELEVDRDRIRIEVYGDLVVTAAGFAGEAGKKLEPIKKLLDSVATVLSEARATAGELFQLPSPPKRLEDKTARPKPIENTLPARPPNFARNLDDEVPF